MLKCSCAINYKKSDVKHSIEKPSGFRGICLQYSVYGCLSKHTFISNSVQAPMEFTFSIYFSVLKDSFVLQSHI